MSESFLVYTSYYSIIEGLADEQLGQLLRALFVYARDGEMIELDPVVKMAFAFIQDDLDRNAEKYEKRCKRNREIAIERERKKRETRARITTNVHERAQTCTNVHLNDNDNDNDIPNGIDNNTCNILQVSPKTEVLEPEEAVFCENKGKKAKRESTNYARIKDYWNERHDETNSGMSRVTMMSERRETMIRARLRQVKGDVSVLFKAIDNAMVSDFLNGNNKRGWTASFDWIFGSGNNFVKVLDGYSNAPAKKTAIQGTEPEEPSLGEVYQKAKLPQSEKDKVAEQTARYRRLIELLERDPSSHCRGALVSAYNAGTLKRLGIDWKPDDNQ